MRNKLMMSDLTGDLLEEILCRVPATSLKRLRSTCKQWNCLFDDGRFTIKHFDKAPKQLMTLMLKETRLCSMSVILHEVPSVEVTGELSLVDPLSSFEDQFKIENVFHCDGLLLCTNECNARMVVWNPCTSETMWIQPLDICQEYAFGSYQDNTSHGNSYKILCYYPKLAIYEINSNSWRSLDITRDFILEYTEQWVSLKGNTYWVASDKKEKQLSIFLLSFDYTTETFGRLSLPYQCRHYKTISLSVVNEEKLTVLLQRESTSRTEIWVTNKIGEAKLVSWRMVLAVDFPPELFIWDGIHFLVDEEKKVTVCCDVYVINDELEGKNLVHIVGEDNKVREVDFGLVEWLPVLLNYVPSLTQIQQNVGGVEIKRDQ